VTNVMHSPPALSSRLFLHDQLQRYRITGMGIWNFKMAAGRHVEFGATGSSHVRSTDPEKNYIEANMKWIGPCYSTFFLQN